MKFEAYFGNGNRQKDFMAFNDFLGEAHATMILNGFDRQLFFF
jgi:hypothetical protein